MWSGLFIMFSSPQMISVSIQGRQYSIGPHYQYKMNFQISFLYRTWPYIIFLFNLLFNIIQIQKWIDSLHNINLHHNLDSHPTIKHKWPSKSTWHIKIYQYLSQQRNLIPIENLIFIFFKHVAKINRVLNLWNRKIEQSW